MVVTKDRVPPTKPMSFYQGVRQSPPDYARLCAIADRMVKVAQEVKAGKIPVCTTVDGIQVIDHISNSKGCLFYHLSNDAREIMITVKRLPWGA